MTRLRPWVMLAVLLLGLAGPVWALEDTRPVTLQDAAGATGNGTAISTAAYTSVALQVVISNTATVTFEGTADNSNWVSVVCTSTASTSGSLVTTATASGMYQCNVAGLSQFRARISAFTNGTVTVKGRLTTAMVKKGGGSGGGAATSFDQLTAGTNTDQLVIGDGGSLSATGTGTIAATTAAALAANPADCAANQFANAIGANGALACAAIADADVPNNITITLAATATALAANGANCSAGQFPLGVDASGAVESCTALPTTIAGTSNEISASGSTGAVTLSLPSSIDLGGKTLEIPNSNTLPATCGVGQIYMDTDATSGRRIYACESANTWALQGDGNTGGGGGSSDGSAEAVQASDGAGGFVDSGVTAASGVLTATEIEVTGAASGIVTVSGVTSGSLRITTADATAQQITVTGAAQTSGATVLTIPDRAGVNGTFAFTDSNVATATALAANGSNCSAGSGALGVSASGAAESCTDFLEAGDNIGAATATTPSANDNDTSVATTAYVQTELTAYASDTVTLTNKTLNCSSGTGNTCTIWERRGGDLVGAADASTAGHVWDVDPLSTTCTAAVVTGTNQTYGVCTFPDSDGEYGRQWEIDVPTGGIVSMNADIWWKGTGSGNARFRVQTLCYASDAAGDAAYSNSTYVTAAAGTSGRLVRVNMPSITITGCDPNERMAIRFSRNRTEGSDTYNAALDVRRVFFNIEVAQ